MAAVLEMPNLLTEKEAAKMLGTSPGTLNVWRCTGAVKIPFIKLGRAVRYKPGDLAAYIQKNTHNKAKGE